MFTGGVIDLVITMAASGAYFDGMDMGQSSGQNPNSAAGAAGGPFDPAANTPGIFRHGSLEQSARGRMGSGYLNEMGTGHTPRDRSPRLSRSPRARSNRRTDDDDDYEDRRAERQESRREGGDPVGVNFRMTACEQSLRDHHTELAAQRLAISQLNDEMRKQMGDREVQNQRLDSVFSLVDQKFGESQRSLIDTQNVAHAKFESLTATMNNLSTGLATRLEELVLEIAVLRREVSSRPTATSQPPSPPPGVA